MHAGTSYAAVVQVNGVTTELDVYATPAFSGTIYNPRYFDQSDTSNDDGATSFGHSSVETLILLEPDIVKIDKKIINGISQDSVKVGTLKRLLKVIESCKAIVIAEGIETKEDLEVLRDLGVNFGQGFYLGRPEIPPNFK